MFDQTRLLTTLARLVVSDTSIRWLASISFLGSTCHMAFDQSLRRRLVHLAVRDLVLLPLLGENILGNNVRLDLAIVVEPYEPLPIFLAHCLFSSFIFF